MNSTQILLERIAQLEKLLQASQALIKKCKDFPPEADAEGYRYYYMSDEVLSGSKKALIACGDKIGKGLLKQSSERHGELLPL